MSVHCKNILIYVQLDATLHSLFYLETALHVSGGTITHHQERKQLYLQHLVFVHEIRKRKAKWIGHILLRNCLPQRVIEGKIQGGIEVTGRQGRRRTKLLDDLKERRGHSHLKEEALDRTMWRAHFGTGFGPVVRQTTE